MTESTKRVVRTGYATIVAFLSALPVLLGFIPLDVFETPVEAKIAVFSAWVVFVNKAINTLEDKGFIPAWLREPDNAPDV